MLNYSFPTTLKFQYTVEGMIHKSEIGINIQDLPSDPTRFDTGTALTRDGTSVPLDIAIDTFMNLWRVQFNSSSVFGSFELWEYPEQSTDGVLRAADTNMFFIGGSGSGTILATQMTYTFRTFEGSIFKLVGLEHVYNLNSQQLYGGLDTNQKNLVDHIMGTGNTFIGKDGSMPISFNKLSWGQNEAIYRKRYR